MTFSEKLKKSLKPVYTSDLVESFYKPVLSEAQLYQRVSGYFSTAGLDLYVDGLEELAKNDGKVQFIISKTISEQDYYKIKSGYKLLEELKPLKLSERNEKLDTRTQIQLGNLAFMIAMGKARVKVALTNKGIFHDKFGIIHSEDSIISFSGSVNETKSGINTNYESISVDFSWDNSEYVSARIESNVARFKRLWNNQEPGVTVIEASELAYEEIAKYQELSDLPVSSIKEDDTPIEMVSPSNNLIQFILNRNNVLRLDYSLSNITSSDRKLRKGSDLSIFFEDDNSTIKSTTTYIDIERIINTTRDRAFRKNIEVKVSDAVIDFLTRSKYSIDQYKILGDVYKGDIESFPNNKLAAYHDFSNIVQSEVARPLYELHLRSAYFEYEMSRAANFSVPGAGKTAMILGVFAYLNRKNAPENEKVLRMVVISPINAFDSWKREFKAVFGEKKKLKVIDSQTASNFREDLNLNWKVSNLILINYEALPSYTSQLKSLMDYETMLIFDEVHRIKNPDGKRAKAALEIVSKPKFKYVLTGTPIPNSYRDIYNFLHILYGNEYSSYFGWDLDKLAKPRIREIAEINKKIHPFFWRTNKNDLRVPIAEPDIVTVVNPSEKQLQLAETIFYHEKSSLARLIRLIQASTNPSLVNQAIDYNELMSFDDDGDVKGISEKEFVDLLGDTNITNNEVYSSLDIDSIVSPKFLEGINIVSNLVQEGKKVLVWGIFVDTIKKIQHSLKDRGIRANLVYGGTDKAERVNLIDEFRDGDVQVLVTNPQTLGESISLHQSVHDAVYFEYDFNLTFMLQSRDRIHRLGLKQDQYTRYHYIQTKDEDWSSYRPGFIDQKIYERIKEKEQIMYRAIDDNSLTIEYSENEINDAIKIIDLERNRIFKIKDY